MNVGCSGGKGCRGVFTCVVHTHLLLHRVSVRISDDLWYCSWWSAGDSERKWCDRWESGEALRISFRSPPSGPPGASLRKRGPSEEKEEDGSGGSIQGKAREGRQCYRRPGRVCRCRHNVEAIYRATVRVAQNRRPVFEGYPPGRRFGKVGGALRERMAAGVVVVSWLVRALIFKGFFCVFAFSIFFLRIASSTLTHFLFFSTLHLQSLRVLSRRLESETCRNTIDQRDAVGTRAQ